MKTISIKWLQALDTDEVDEACVDCYDEEEQYSALAEMAGQESAFPFLGKVVGEAAEVDDDTEDSGGGHG